MYHLKGLFELRRSNIPQICVTSYATNVISYLEITPTRKIHNNNQVNTRSNQYDSIYLQLRDTIVT